MTPFRVFFNSYVKRNREQLITVTNGQGVPICGSGNIIFESSIVLKDVLHLPQLTNSLISVKKLTKDLNCSATFFSTYCIFQDLATGKTISTAKEQSGLYLLESNDQRKTKIMSQQATSETWANSQIWLHHKRLGHPSFNLIKSLFPHLFTKESIESFNCDICQLSKHHRASYPISNKKSISPFDLKFFRLVQNQFGKNIKRIRSDNGTEYVNHEFLNFLSHNGIVHELTCVNTPQQNGVAERKNRHLLEVTRALLFQMFVPKNYWGEAVLTATYLINKLPTRILNGISPIESLLSFIPSSSLISSLPSRVFGCTIFVHSHHPNRSKLDPKALKCVFIEYPSNKKRYKCYHPQSRRVFITMDVTFHKTQSFYANPPLQGEKALEVEELSFLSLPYLSL
uniref:Retrovirus-related Pol polyprotein from transposon TNT 1-94 n=1 Tax=Cajanus cajan TaxID=3821 RepID=A0A151T519_CAJCA|nr:Retrovirus-related Pol polyprotein from transposon TNT 1-94 [Cajanus cajan]